MKVKLYRVSSGFLNVEDQCSLDDLHNEWQQELQIEVPDSFRVEKNAWGETILLDSNGLECEVNYVRSEGNCPVEPYVLLVSYAIVNGRMAGSEYRFEIL